MKQRVNNDFKRFEFGKVMYVFSYNLYVSHPEVSVPGSKKLDNEKAKQLDGYIVKLASNKAVSAFMKGVMVAPQWCYPAPYSYEKRAEQFNRNQRWNRASHSGRRVIIG